MNLKSKLALVAALAIVSLSASPALAVFIPVGPQVITTVKPAVPPTRSGENIKAHNGTAYTIATFCPAAAAAGTCTGESLSEPSGGNVVTPGTAAVTSCSQPGVEVTIFPPSTKGASKPC